MKIPFNLNFLDSIVGIKIILFFEIVLPLLLIFFESSFVQVYKAPPRRGVQSLGSLSRAEQAYFTAYSDFAYSFKKLELLEEKKHYQFRIVSPVNFNVSNLNSTSSKIIGVIILAVPQKTKVKSYDYSSPYISTVFYDTNTRDFSKTICRGFISDGTLRTLPGTLLGDSLSNLILSNLTSVPILSSNIGIYPYQTGIYRQDKIYDCPSGFKMVIL